jgi:hypothetical protein
MSGKSRTSARAVNFDSSPREPGQILYIPGQLGGFFSAMPKGVILHGSRSGVASRNIHDEFIGTANWAANNPGGLSWNATIGEDEIALHLPEDEWGHNARRASGMYLAVEFSQPTVNHSISDAQVEAFCWWFQNKVTARWEAFPLTFPTHAEVEAWGLTGRIDGKTDVFPNGDPRTDELRQRILARL